MFSSFGQGAGIMATSNILVLGEQALALERFADYDGLERRPAAFLQ